jgi:hypothetical protein
MDCLICKSDLEYCFSEIYLRKYTSKLYRCPKCGLIKVANPYWLEEAYSDAIVDADTGIVSRNISISNRLSLILYFLFKKDINCLDIAGGYGLLTRMMRDNGFNFSWHDIYCKNILARGFEIKEDGTPIDCISAIEVIEHVENPLEFIRLSMHKFNAKTIIMTTELYVGEKAPNPDWWYYTFNSGQHISFFQIKTFQYISIELGLNCYFWNNIIIMTHKKLYFFHILKIIPRILIPLAVILIKKKLGSKTFLDHKNII